MPTSTHALNYEHHFFVNTCHHANDNVIWRVVLNLNPEEVLLPW